MDGETAALTRDQLRALKKSWVWQEVILPYLEAECAQLMALALDPRPALREVDALKSNLGYPRMDHAEARHRLDQLRQFQRFLESAEINAAQIASDAPPDLRDVKEEETDL